MHEHDRISERSRRIQSTSADGSTTGTTIEARRTSAEQALAAIDERLEEALSGNSRAFLDANQQTGGQ